MTQPRENLVKMNRGLYRPSDINPNIVTGTFTIGAAATFYETQTGQGAIVARTGAGTYTLTLADTDVVDVISATFCIEDRAGAHTDLIARAEDIAVAAGVATIDCEAYAAAVATDVLTANNLYCHYQIVYTRAWQGQPDTRSVDYYHHGSTPTLVCGRVEIGAAGAVGTIHGAGIAGIVGGAGTGTYTVTFVDAFNQFISGQVNAGNASAAGGDLSSNFGAFTAGAAGAATLEIFTQAAAVATDPANGGCINFAVYLTGEESGA